MANCGRSVYIIERPLSLLDLCLQKGELDVGLIESNFSLHYGEQQPARTLVFRGSIPGSRRYGFFINLTSKEYQVVIDPNIRITEKGSTKEFFSSSRSLKEW